MLGAVMGFRSLCEKLASEEGVSIATARLMLRMLVVAGILSKRVRGWYELAPPPASCEEDGSVGEGNAQAALTI